MPAKSYISQKDLTRVARLLAAGVTQKRSAEQLRWAMKRLACCIARLHEEVRREGERHWLSTRDTAREWLRMRGACTPAELVQAKGLFPSSIGVSLLVPAEARALAVTATWGDYAPVPLAEGERRAPRWRRHALRDGRPPARGRRPGGPHGWTGWRAHGRLVENRSWLERGVWQEAARNELPIELLD